MNTTMMKDTVGNLARENYPTFIKAIISVETGIVDRATLDAIYERYIEKDDVILLNEYFYMWMQ